MVNKASVTMNTDSQETALAVFGSAARGDNDIFSDQDLLIVSENEKDLRKMKALYESAGWSCTAYSWKRLQKAADQGSLFVQHLKQEAMILHDPYDRLSHLLALYSPKTSYKSETEGAASLVGTLMEHLPQCDAGPMWTLDVLSVGFRSLAVAKLADEGIYAFSNLDLINGLTRIGTISGGEGAQLFPLRQFKSLYRKGMIDKRISWYDAFDKIRLIDRIFTLQLSSHCAGTLDILELALSNTNTGHSDSYWYTRCRRIESALWMLNPQQAQERSEFAKQRQKLFGIIKSPNIYAWYFVGGYNGIQSGLSALAEMSIV